VGFIPQSAWARLEKDENLVETIRASKIAYAKPLKVAWGAGIGHGSSIIAIEPKKWMQYPSITIPKSFMGGMFPYIYIYNIVCNLTLESNLFFCVRLWGTTKEAFVANAIQLVLKHCQLFTHHHATKAIEVTTKYCTYMGIPSNSFSEEE
jgi:hypothetical protein